MRNIILFFTSDNREVTVQSSARTLGELKSQLTSENLSNKKLTVMETRATLESPSSVLPEGEFTLYVYPAQSKAGMEDYQKDEIVDALRDAEDALKDFTNQIAELRRNIFGNQPTGNTRIDRMRDDAERLRREIEGE